MDDQLAEMTALCDSISKGIEEHSFVTQDSVKNSQNGISLLGLKNQTLLAYINNLVLVAAAQLQRSQGDTDTELFHKAVEHSIEQRVTLEKGVKGLESKISYQVDKALRAHRKLQESQTQAKTTQKAGDENSDSEADEDPTSFRPNLGQLRTRNDDPVVEEGDKPAKYVAPKLTATTPFSKERRPKRRDFTMEEYIHHAGEAPVAEPSIGTTIMDHGRGGMRTDTERRKQKEIDDYEEANFTRIQNVSAKQAKRDARKRQRDASTRSLFGEDWGFLDNEGPGRGGGGKKFSGKRRKH